jgi:hypothetical protein
LTLNCEYSNIDLRVDSIKQGCRMNHFKVAEGLSRDNRFTEAARAAGLPRGAALAVWLFLLDRASAARPRGHVMNSDATEIAAVLEFDASSVARLLETLRNKKMIAESGVLAGWEKMHPLSTMRTRAFRARQRRMAAEQAARLRLLEEMRSQHEKKGRLLSPLSAGVPLIPWRQK